MCSQNKNQNKKKWLRIKQGAGLLSTNWVQWTTISRKWNDVFPFFFFFVFFFSLIYATSRITNCLFWEFCYFLSYFNIMIIIFEFSSQVFLFAKLYDAKGICFFIIFSYKYIQFSLGIGNYAATKKKGKNVLKQTCQRFIFIFVSFKGKHV